MKMKMVCTIFIYPKNAASLYVIFKFLHNTAFDLKDFGIYTEVVPENYTENCIIRALRIGGLEELKLNRLKTFVIDRYVPMCKLKDICKKLNIRIKVRKMRIFINKDSGEEEEINEKPFYYGEGDVKEYEIGLLDKHYFLIKDPTCFFTLLFS